MVEKWLIKDSRGRIRGPYTSADVIKRINLGEVVGTEKISTFPGGHWRSIAKVSLFYDAILETVKGGRSSALDGSLDSGLANSIDGTSDAFSENQRIKKFGSDDATDPKLDNLEQSIVNTHTAPSSKKSDQSKKEARGRTLGTDRKDDSNGSSNKRKFHKNEDVTINLSDVDSIRKSEKKKSIVAPIIFFVLGGVVLLYFLLLKPKVTGDMVLLRPLWGTQSLSEAQIKQKIKKSMSLFLLDTTESYLSVQNELVQTLESKVLAPDAFELLCMAYRELWPLSKQGSEDIETLHQVAQKIKHIAPGGRASEVCRIVEISLVLDYNEAHQSAISILNHHPDYIFINELMGEFEYSKKKYRTSLFYYSQAKDLWTPPPKWIKPIFQEALIRARSVGAEALQNTSFARQTFKQILKFSPQHVGATIELARIESDKFRQNDLAETLLNGLLTKKVMMPLNLSSELYLILSKIKKRQGDKEMALAYAEKSFELYSANTEAKELALELGAGAKIKKSVGNARDRIFLGDQYAKADNCLSAQVEYRTAFSIDEKNAVAAMKAGECLWKLNQSDEAIEWLKKSVQADSQFVPAYVKLADYFSRKYDYTAAVTVLKKAQAIQPKSYEILKGFAMIELRRKNFLGALSYGEKAYALYDTDLETILILGESSMMNNDYEKALSYASRAIEIEPNDTKSQALYAKVLAGLRGVATAISYLKEKIAQQPQNAEFRILLGELTMLDENFQQAEVAFKQALQLDSQNKVALLKLGGVLQRQKKYREALEAFLTAATLDPSDSEPIFLTGKLYIEMNQLEKAIKQFERVLRVNKFYPLAHYQIANAYFLQKDSESALKEIELEKQQNPKLIDSFVLASEIHLSLKQFSNCASELQQAIDLGAKNAQIYVRIARCYRQTGSIDAASAMLNQAAVVESGFADIYREQGLIFETQAQYDKALEAFTKYLILAPQALDRFEIESRMRSMPR